MPNKTTLPNESTLPSESTLPPSPRPRKSSASTRQKGCVWVGCVDPATGDFVQRPKGHCPPGYVEKVKQLIRDRGIVFRDNRNK